MIEALDPLRLRVTEQCARICTRTKLLFVQGGLMVQ